MRMGSIKGEQVGTSIYTQVNTPIPLCLFFCVSKSTSLSSESPLHYVFGVLIMVILGSPLTLGTRWVPEH